MADVLEPTSPEQREVELQTNLRFIARALRHIEAGEDFETELRNLRTFILDCLEGAEASGDLIHAADELYRRAHELAYEQEREILLDEEPHVSPTLLEAAEAALARFQIALSETRLNTSPLGSHAPSEEGVEHHLILSAPHLQSENLRKGNVG